jgi:YegS/Rv2252/BmrU family lipid kinase
MSSAPYKKIHVVINPASGKDEPVINVLNRAFSEHEVDWSVSITRKYGDATEFARQAAESGFDLVAGYGGDGTQHEIANGIMGTNAVLAPLPGGTGNGFGTEMGMPNKLADAVQVICTSSNVRNIDIAQMGDAYFIQRLYTGIEPEQQTSREAKDKYGTLAYMLDAPRLWKEMKDVPHRITIDGEVIEDQGIKCYVVNSARAGTGLSIDEDFSVEDGYLDVFMLSNSLKSVGHAVDRFLHLQTEGAQLQCWRGKEIKIEADPSQAIWADGEVAGRTPVEVKVLPGALTVAVP